MTASVQGGLVLIAIAIALAYAFWSGATAAIVDALTGRLQPGSG